MQPIQFPEELPISARREDILAAIRAHQVVVIAGETGSGKTTQLPKLCLAAGLAEKGRIGCTQPRRVAALSVSRRVAEELGVTWGREVGCKMRFNDDTGRETKIKFMTDGILLAEIQSDPLLRAYSTLIIDEAHERSLNIDFLLGYLQELLRKRPDLKLLITSATIDTEAFSKAFGGAPIIEVSGRLWPVEIRYAPMEAHVKPGEEPDEIDHVEAAVRATEDALIESDDGDVLVFMPTERDIRDTRDALEGSLGSSIEVLGLFGRMPAAEQQRIFAPSPRRRVIVATNIAETSITLPRIRYVIDAGLSRISRYNPRTRTKRLPIEDVAQSSANQRAGRAGRVQHGICIRLYDEEDFQKRPRFTQPEIQRANLAEVILRMKAFRLGDIETFPFVDPPHAAAIRAGYQLLHELGAINEVNELTPLGRELARLPIDPTLGRMLLQAREEGVLPDVLVIAAGLSVPDPRERPEENKEAAATAHKAFAHPHSDFLTLLNIWRAATAVEGKNSGNAMRRFCKANFLSASRMREWRDIYAQLEDAVREDAPRPVAGQRPSNRRPDPEAGDRHYEAVHRSILTGLLGHIAQRHERNSYKAGGNRLVTLFPGSNLYERRDPSPKRGSRPNPNAKPAAEKIRQPLWIVAGEIVETSQLFARTAAGIDPEWIVELGAHLCSTRHTEPHWSAKAGRVLALERVLLHGLEIARRLIDYGRIDPVHATELFIRGALVAEEAKLPHRFFTENHKVREKIETALTRVRSRRAHDLDEALFQFYAARVENVSSVHDMNRLVRDRIVREPNFLCATEADLVGEDDTTYDRTLFPDKISLGNTVLPIVYAYTPGTETDGVTVKVPLPIAEQLTSGELQWLVPGLRNEQISVLLRALPKAIRKPLMPIEPKIREVAAEFQPGKEDFLTALAAFLTRKYRVPIKASDWPPQSLPIHLQPRVEVVTRGNEALASGRDLGALQAEVKKREVRSTAWDKAALQWSKQGLTSWSFGDLPESIVIEEVGGVPLLAYPGLEKQDAAIGIRLFRTKAEAESSTAIAIRRLAELVIPNDMKWLRKEVAGLARLLPVAGRKPADFRNALDQLALTSKSTTAPFLTPEVLERTAPDHLLAHALVLHPVLPLTKQRFDALLEKTRRELPSLVHQLGEWIKRIATLRQEITSSPRRYTGLEQDLQRLAPSDFLTRVSFSRLPHLHRYLRAVQIRAERASVSPAKDAERVRQLTPFAEWEKRVPEQNRERFRWLLEEFRVSLFAQELGTAEPASAQRLRSLGNWPD
jgi:ATP-dependent helicase HrpA